MIIHPAPFIPMRIRPYEAMLLATYLGQRAELERSPYLSGFLSYAANSVIKDALTRIEGPIRWEHDREQTEALLREVGNGYDPNLNL